MVSSCSQVCVCLCVISETVARDVSSALCVSIFTYVTYYTFLLSVTPVLTGGIFKLLQSFPLCFALPSISPCSPHPFSADIFWLSILPAVPSKILSDAICFSLSLSLSDSPHCPFFSPHLAIFVSNWIALLFHAVIHTIFVMTCTL